MPSTRVRVRVPLWGSTISQRPTTKVRSAQARRARKLPTPWAAKAAAARQALTMTRTMPMKIAAPRAKISGRMIATQPIADRDDADRAQRAPGLGEARAHLGVE